MYTDWLIVRRLAAELDRAVRSGRIREVGITPDGRFALRIRARGAGGDALVVDAFGDMPLVTLEHGVEPAPRPGWSRAIADTIGGLRVEGVRSRRGDRLIAVDVASVSRFGVLRSYRLVAELVPRFGNILLLHDDIVVAAAREFTREQNPRRAVTVGERYEPPPLPAPSPDPAGLVRELERLLAEDTARSGAPRALRARVPLLPQMVAASLVADPAPAARASGGSHAERLVERAESIVQAAAGEPDDLEEVYVYWDGARVVQAHVVRLHQFAGLEETRKPALLPVLSGALEADRSTRGVRSAGSRRAALLARVQKREAALKGDRARLERERDDAGLADSLRVQGELLYAHHAEVPTGVTEFVPSTTPGVRIALDPELDAKANAAAIFRRYRKAVAKQAHVARRLAENATEITAAEELAWEIERADAGELEDLQEDVDRLEHRSRTTPRPARGQVRRTALEVPLGDDSRVLVGRSPRDNADLTFRVARPEDLWFHARGVPGAHVVLRIDSSRMPTSAELRSAAELAAYHSKARTAGTVPVDYTARKYVRKQQGALPGLVWYTNAKTIDVTPRAAQ